MQIWTLTDRRYLRQRMPRALTSALLAAEQRVSVVIADDGSQVSMVAPAAERLSVWAGLEPDNLVLVRSRHPLALALLEEAEARGASTLISSAALRRVRDKVSVALTLDAHGLPTPETFVAYRPEDLVRIRPPFPLLLKPFQAESAQGLRLVRTSRELVDVPWGDSLVLAQRYVNGGGFDLKVYVAGERVWALRRRSPLSDGDPDPQRIEVGPEIARLARGCAAAFSLPLLGLDVVEGSEGPMIVDVAEFPNYEGIDEAPEAIAQLILKYTHEQTAAAGARR